VDQNEMAVFLTRNDCEGPKGVDGTGYDMLWNDCEEDGDVSIESEEDECPDCVHGNSNTNWYWQTESDMVCVLGE
jgi:hypothetical protein